MKAIDLFAGWGGLTLGAELAGLDVVWAANHWPLAVEVHAANHPHAQHVCQDLHQANWHALPSYEVLLAAPACQGHSEAGRVNANRWGVHALKKHDADRATAWAVVACAEATRPKLIIVENVVQFRSQWALYPVWRQALETLGYTVRETVAVASLHGDTPQRRERVFITASLARGRDLELEAHAEPAFGPCIEWDAPGWRPIASARTPKARARIRAAQRLFGKRCLVQHVDCGGGRAPLHEPIRTITTKDQWVVTDGSRYRPLTLREYARAQGFPDSYTWREGLSRADVVHGLGNAVPPRLAKAVVQAACSATEAA